MKFIVSMDGNAEIARYFLVSAPSKSEAFKRAFKVWMTDRSDPGYYAYRALRSGFCFAIGRCPKPQNGVIGVNLRSEKRDEDTIYPNDPSRSLYRDGYREIILQTLAEMKIKPRAPMLFEV